MMLGIFCPRLTQRMRELPVMPRSVQTYIDEQSRPLTNRPQKTQGYRIGDMSSDMMISSNPQDHRAFAWLAARRAVTVSRDSSTTGAGASAL